MTYGVWVILGLGLLGCGSDADDAKRACLDPSRLVDASVPLPESAAEVQSQCLAAGLPAHDCDPANFISQAQAECIVRASNPPEGEWRVSLVFAAVTRRPIWNVRIDVSGPNAEHFGVDAITGDIVRRSTSTSVA